ncbi:MAG: DNA-binding transcriptional LysR family regulator [Planctomycetota bacterium]|jgi:DNA-binding transcriptional LysR family regulator
MKNLPIDLLRSFITVADFGSFTQASELLARSQPAISMQIKRLEKLIDRALFERSDQKLNLTEEGELLFDYAKKILLLNDEAISTFIKPSISGNIRLGIPSEFATTLLPKIVGRFSQNYPTVSLDVSCDLSVNLLSARNEKEFDLILALQDDLKAKKSDRVRVDELVWVTKDKHNAHLQSPIPLIAAPTGCIYRKRAIDKLNDLNKPWRMVYTVPDLSGIQAAIEEGLGVTVLAKSTVPDNLQIIKPNGTFPGLGKIAIHLIKKSDKADEAVMRLMEYIKVSMS